MSDSYIWPTDMTQSGATTPGQSESVGDGNVGLIRIPKAPALFELHHQIV